MSPFYTVVLNVCLSSPAEVPLHERMSRQFNEQVLMPELEKRKAALAVLRDQKRPIDMAELKHHEHQVNQRHEQVFVQVLHIGSLFTCCQDQQEVGHVYDVSYQGYYG